METLLRRLYRGGGIAGAACIFLIAFCVVTEIVIRLFGMTLPGVIEVATFALVGASFLALAHTFRHNVHIRITVVTQRLPAKLHRPLEMFALAVAGAMAFWLTFYGGTMTWEAYIFNDRSDGLLSIPLWIPEAVMTGGILLLGISIVEEFVRMLRGHEPIYELRRRITQETEDADDPASGPDFGADR
jgi:TRAP-type C4-dicarboxylate transport system permease small subunit